MVASALIQSDAPRLIVYGVLAQPQPFNPRENRLKRRFKRQLHEFKDRLGLTFGSTRTLDYRNYENLASTNVGDVAIATQTEKLFADAFPEHSVVRINWGDTAALESCLNDRPTRADFLVVAGSGYVAFDRQNRLAERVERDFELLRRSPIRKAMLGVGINTPGRSGAQGRLFEIDESCRHRLQELLGTFDALSVRDRFSQDVFGGFTGRPVNLIGDQALFCHSLPQTGAASVHAPTGLIGINFSFHGATSTQIMRRNFFAYVTTLNEIRRRTGCRFRYFVHYNTELFIARALLAQGLPIEISRGTPEQMCAAYAEVDAHIGGMLHSCILAHSAGTPALALAYDIKHLGFFELFGLERYCLSAIDFDSDLLIDRLLEMLGRQAEIRGTIISRRQALERDARAFVEFCRSIPDV